MRDSVKHGLTTAYYNNGNIESKTMFKEGIQLGEQLFYDEGSNLTSKYLVDSTGGIIDYYEYYPSGKVYFYAPDLMNSKGTVYDSLGNKLYDLVYQNGELMDTLKFHWFDYPN